MIVRILKKIVRSVTDDTTRLTLHKWKRLMTGFARSLKETTFDTTRIMYENRDILIAISRVDLAKRYSGSVFGLVWVALYPALLLSIYVFVYMVVFKMRFPGMGEYDYVLFIFTGLIPYLGLAEALTSGSVSVKQNIHLVKNVMLPIELIPVKAVILSMVSQVVSMVILTLMLGIGGVFSCYLFWAPVVFLLQVMFLVGLVWILSALAVIILDVGYFVNLVVLLLMFISPIAFTPDMVHGTLKVVIYLNPIFYMTEMFRGAMLYGRYPDAELMMAYFIMCVGTYCVGAMFFCKLKGVLVDYE